MCSGTQAESEGDALRMRVIKIACSGLEGQMHTDMQGDVLARERR